MYSGQVMYKWDIRLIQLVIMAALLIFGAMVNEFDLDPKQVALTFLVGILTQIFFIRYFRLPLSFLSVLITCFGVSLLLRSDNLWVHPLAILFAIAAKFLIRYQGSHLFNPANFAVIIGLAFLPGSWVTSGQWGADWVIAAWLIMLGIVVAGNAGRLDISVFF
jgi:Na+-transporting NADH:ubiquinone oxidoreductase subunit NqrB